MGNFLSNFDTILKNPTVSNLAGSFLNKKPTPAPSAAAPVINVQSPAMPNSGMSSSTMMLIGGGVLALVAVLFLAMKK